MSRAHKTSSRQAVQPAEPLRLFAVVHAASNKIASPEPLAERDIVTAFLTAEHAQQSLDGAEVSAADRKACRVVEFIEVRQPPERETPWGEGQFDHVQVGPGVTIALRITPDGCVKMLSPGGEIDVTDGSSSLGTGLHEAGRRGAEIRSALLDRARRRGAKPLCARCGQSLFGYVDHRGEPSYPVCQERGRGEELRLCEPAAPGESGARR